MVQINQGGIYLKFLHLGEKGSKILKFKVTFTADSFENLIAYLISNYTQNQAGKQIKINLR